MLDRPHPGDHGYAAAPPPRFWGDRAWHAGSSDQRLSSSDARAAFADLGVWQLLLHVILCPAGSRERLREGMKSSPPAGQRGTTLHPAKRVGCEAHLLQGSAEILANPLPCAAIRTASRRGLESRDTPSTRNCSRTGQAYTLVAYALWVSYWPIGSDVSSNKSVHAQNSLCSKSRAWANEELYSSIVWYKFW